MSGSFTALAPLAGLSLASRTGRRWKDRLQAPLEQDHTPR